MTWKAPPFALDVGQELDVVASLPEGEGRLHAQRFPGGEWRTHRDRYDPARGPVEAVAHVVAETPTGKALVGLSALAILVALIRAHQE